MLCSVDIGLKRRWSVVLPFAVIVVVLFGATFLITKPYIAETEKPEQIRVFWLVLTSAQATFYATVSAAIFTAAGFVAAIGTWTTSITDKRKERAYNMISMWNTQDVYDKVRHINSDIWDAIRDSSVSADRAHAIIEGDSKMRQSVVQILNLLEDWSLAVHTEYIDEVVLERSMATSFLTVYIKMYKYIKHIRDAIEPRYYCELHAYAILLIAKGWTPSDLKDYVPPELKGA